MQQAKVGQWLVQVKPFPKLPPSERCTGLWNWLEKMPEDGEIQISSLNYTSTHGLDVGSVEVRYLEYRLWLEWLDIMHGFTCCSNTDSCATSFPRKINVPTLLCALEPQLRGIWRGAQGQRPWWNCRGHVRQDLWAGTQFRLPQGYGHTITTKNRKQRRTFHHSHFRIPQEKQPVKYTCLEHHQKILQWNHNPVGSTASPKQMKGLKVARKAER